MLLCVDMDCLCRQAGKLKDWGLAGVVAYGLLNTVYYSLAFVICWVYFANIPKGGSPRYHSSLFPPSLTNSRL